MTIIDWGLLGVFLLSVVLLIILVARKISQLVVIDLATIAKERESSTRERLLRERIRRQFAAFVQWEPIHALAHRMDRFAHHLETDDRAQMMQRSHHGKATLVELQEQALRAFQEKRHALAEEYTVELIRQHPQHVHAYALLGRIKLATHAYTEARDALQFAVRMAEKEAATGFVSEGDDDGAVKQVNTMSDRELALLWCDLAHATQEQGNATDALEQLESAALLMPNDPKILDALLSAAILVKKKDVAEETLARLQAINPENEKLASFTEKVAAMVSPKRAKKK